ncbi:MAG: type II toxin-antitoxin system RelE/ParE family toxin [Planctomycetes bacterium]|nr:type II toxin-antitoxin system RelE/ParE family toxin [Planctomycetota bacterium]
MPYVIHLKPAAERDLASLPPEIQPRIRPRIDALAVDPRPPGVRKMKGGGRRWRIRVGDYRVIFLIDDAGMLVTVTRIGHRSDVYD